jgi:hypothetical protein
MATVAELQCCDGFAVEGRDGLLGWVEETWLDGTEHAGALAVRTPDGRRALLLAKSVQAVDVDSQEVLVAGDETLLELDAPHLEESGDELKASWRTTGAVLQPVGGAASAAPAGALAAARGATAHRERPAWQYVVLALVVLATLIAFEIGLAFGIAYAVTGRAY